ncbi:MAG: dihydrofolate reductase [Candidatus Kapabacteria bacterium]|nr:dihydrofolate reductase [Candidatus Kapabacteria bacterium]
MNNQRKLVLYIAASADGYIAMPGDDLRFLARVQKDGEDYGYADFLTSVDTVIIGRKTYDWVLTNAGFYPHADKTSYVVTRTEKPSVGSTHFYTGDLTDLITTLKREQGKDIFCDGGAEIVNELLRRDLIDTFIISIIPVFVGGGTRLFQDARPEQTLTLTDVKTFDTGLVQLHYQRERTAQ